MPDDDSFCGPFSPGQLRIRELMQEILITIITMTNEQAMMRFVWSTLGLDRDDAKLSKTYVWLAAYDILDKNNVLQYVTELRVD